MITFSTPEKRAFILAMNLINSVDGPHPSKKQIFNSVYKTLDISYEEGLSILSYVNNSRLSFDEHYSQISKMDLEKRKALISILTVLSTIGEDINGKKSEILTGHRAFCDLTYAAFSTLEAVIYASKFILKPNI